MPNDLETALNVVEQVATDAGTVAAAVGGVPGKIADAAIVGAEAIAGSVEGDVTAGRHTALTDATDALQAVIDKTPAAVAGLPAEDAQKAIEAAEQASGLLATLKTIWADVELVFKDVKSIV